MTMTLLHYVNVLQTRVLTKIAHWINCHDFNPFLGYIFWEIYVCKFGLYISEEYLCNGHKHYAKIEKNHEWNGLILNNSERC